VLKGHRDLRRGDLKRIVLVVVFLFLFFRTLFIPKEIIFLRFIPSRLVPPPGGRLGAVGSHLWQRLGTNLVVVV